MNDADLYFDLNSPELNTTLLPIGVWPAYTTPPRLRGDHTIDRSLVRQCRLLNPKLRILKTCSEWVFHFQGFSQYPRITPIVRHLPWEQYGPHGVHHIRRVSKTLDAIGFTGAPLFYSTLFTLAWFTLKKGEIHCLVSAQGNLSSDFEDIYTVNQSRYLAWETIYPERAKRMYELLEKRAKRRENHGS